MDYVFKKGTCFLKTLVFIHYNSLLH